MAAKKKRTTRRRRRKGGSGIYIKPANRGKLRKTAKVKKGKKIPVSKLRAMKKSKNAATRKRATFALNARGWRKTGGKRRKR